MPLCEECNKTIREWEVGGRIKGLPYCHRCLSVSRSARFVLTDKGLEHWCERNARRHRKHSGKGES